MPGRMVSFSNTPLPEVFSLRVYPWKVTITSGFHPLTLDPTGPEKSSSSKFLTSRGSNRIQDVKEHIVLSLSFGWGKKGGMAKNCQVFIGFSGFHNRKVEFCFAEIWMILFYIRIIASRFYIIFCHHFRRGIQGDDLVIAFLLWYASNQKLTTWILYSQNAPPPPPKNKVI